MVYVPLGDVNGATPQFWVAGEVQDFWLEIDHYGVVQLGAVAPTTLASAPIKRLHLALGPLYSSPNLGLAGIAGRKVRITFDDDGGFPDGQLQCANPNVGDTYDYRLPSRMLSEYMSILDEPYRRPMRPVHWQCNTEDPAFHFELGGWDLTFPKDCVEVLAVFLHAPPP